MSSLKLYALGAALLLLLLMAVGLYYQHSVISSQSDTIASQASKLEGLEKQSEAREETAKQRSKDLAKAKKDRDDYAKRLEEAQSGDVCANSRLNDDTSRVLNDLYNSQPSF